jgi:hypothetical protein
MGINTAGTVVGHYLDSGSVFHGYLFVPWLKSREVVVSLSLSGWRRHADDARFQISKWGRALCSPSKGERQLILSRSATVRLELGPVAVVPRPEAIPS